MNRRNLLALAALAFVVLALAAVGCVKDRPEVSVMGVTNLDSLTLRDNLVVGKATSLGSGGMAVTGNFTMSNGAILNSKGAVTVTDSLLVTVDLDVAGNAMSTSGAFRINDPTLITGTLGVSSQIVAANGIKATGGLTLSSAGDLVLAGGTIWDDSADVTVLDDLGVGGALEIAGNFSDAGALLRLNDNTLVTGTLGVSSQANMANGLTVANGLTLTGNLYDAWALRLNADVLITGGMNIYGPVGGMGPTFRINDATIITGDLTVVGGNIADDGGSVRINDNALITGTVNATGAATFNSTVGVDSKLTASNGIAAAGGITSTGLITVSNWGLFYGVVLQPAVTQVLTANYGITPTNYSLMYILDDGTQATGTIALDTTVSIVDGTYPGQLLLVFWMDAHGATLTIQDAGNMQGPANADVILGYQDSALFMWDALSTDWLCINVTDL